jgi:DNA-binding SARP family transcriptional activator/TolB-like protein
MTGISLKAQYYKNTAGSDTTAVRHDVLSISVLGNMSLAFNGRDIKIRSRKSRAVLAFLALSESRQETRERLVGLFWSESEEHKARASLRQTLRELRQVLFEAGYHGLQTEKLAIELDPQSLEVDLWSVIHAAEAHQAHPLVLNISRVAECLLDGFEDIDPEFRVWLLAKRQTFQDRLIRGLEAGLLGGGAEASSKKLLAEAIINLDPTHEEACRFLMQTRAEEGDTSGALRVYKMLWDLLDEEYGMEPSAKTQKLVAEIKQGSIDSAPLAPSPTTPPRFPIPDSSSPPQTFRAGRLVQLPPDAQSELTAPPLSKIVLLVSQFQMNGVGPDKVHLVHGFRHHLIASLIRFREWSVVDDMSAPSSTQARSTNTAQYSIDATAYQAGDVANVVLTLRQNETNAYVWSETFELKLENWFEAQQRVIRRTTTSLNVQLSTERLMRLAGEPDVSLTVYDRWLRGQAMMWRFHHADWDRPAQIFEDCIREAPNFSPGYSSLAGWNNAIHIAQPGVFRDPNRAQHNVELARKAVQLDALDARAQLCLGWAYAMAKQYTQAEPHMDLARELNDSDPWMKIASSLFYSFRGKFDRADTLADQAFEMTLVPSLTDWAYLASIRFLAGDYEAAIVAADRAQDVIRTLRAWKAAALFHLGRHDEARAEAARFLAAIRSFWFGALPPTDEAIARWFLHLYPISEKSHWERLRAGIIGAGVPVSGIEHHAW